MKTINKLNMFSVTVSNMAKSKAFYIDTLGLSIKEEKREDDDNWWITMSFPGGGANMTLARAAKYGADEAVKPGMVGMYMEVEDIEAAREELSKKGMKIGETMDDLFGPGSGVLFFSITDPDGNSINVLQPKA